MLGCTVLYSYGMRAAGVYPVLSLYSTEYQAFDCLLAEVLRSFQDRRI